MTQTHSNGSWLKRKSLANVSFRAMNYGCVTGTFPYQYLANTIVGIRGFSKPLIHQPKTLKHLIFEAIMHDLDLHETAPFFNISRSRFEIELSLLPNLLQTQFFQYAQKKNHHESLDLRLFNQRFHHIVL